jgi:hypothetical protein
VCVACDELNGGAGSGARDVELVPRHIDCDDRPVGIDQSWDCSPGSGAEVETSAGAVSDEAYRG